MSCMRLKTVSAEADARWAMLKVLIPKLDIQQFRLPSRRVQLAETAAAAYRPSYARQELKTLLAASGEEVARVCAKLSGQEVLLDKILQSGECVSLRGLAVNGRDFPALQGRSAGKCCVGFWIMCLLSRKTTTARRCCVWRRVGQVIQMRTVTKT